jgi:hypothetical protein
MRGLTIADYPKQTNLCGTSLRGTVARLQAAVCLSTLGPYGEPPTLQAQRHAATPVTTPPVPSPSNLVSTLAEATDPDEDPASATGSSWQTGAIVPYIPSAIVLCRPIPHLDTYSKELLLICKPMRRLSRMSARSSSIVGLRMSDIQQPGLPLTSLEIREHRQVFDPAC